MSFDDAIVSNSLDQPITSWNEGAQRLFGFTAEELSGKPASLYMPPEWNELGRGFSYELKTRLDHCSEL